MNNAIDNKERTNNVEDYFGDRKMIAYQVEYWSNNYYCWSKDYENLMTNIIKKKKFRKNNQQSPLLQLEHTLFSKLKIHRKKGRQVCALFLRNQEKKLWIDHFSDIPRFKDNTFKASNG